jgi:hypothetical protein
MGRHQMRSNAGPYACHKAPRRVRQALPRDLSERFRSVVSVACCGYVVISPSRGSQDMLMWYGLLTSYS